MFAYTQAFLLIALSLTNFALYEQSQTRWIRDLYFFASPTVGGGIVSRLSDTDPHTTNQTECVGPNSCSVLFCELSAIPHTRYVLYTSLTASPKCGQTIDDYLDRVFSFGRPIQNAIQALSWITAGLLGLCLVALIALLVSVWWKQKNDHSWIAHPSFAYWSIVLLYSVAAIFQISLALVIQKFSYADDVDDEMPDFVLAQIHKGSIVLSMAILLQTAVFISLFREFFAKSEADALNIPPYDYLTETLTQEGQKS